MSVTLIICASALIGAACAVFFLPPIFDWIEYRCEKNWDREYLKAYSEREKQVPEFAQNRKLN